MATATEFVASSPLAAATNSGQPPSPRTPGGRPPSENIQVYVRVRPCNDRERDNGFQPCLTVQNGDSVVINTKPAPRTFTFDVVADEKSTQEDVFNKVGKEITDQALAGYNGTIFAYGQTGSGKTFTIQGDDASNEHRGLMPRVFDYLCAQMARNQRKSGGNLKYLCKCSFLEIYEDKIFDLLDHDPCAYGMPVHEDIKKGVYVEGLTEQSVSNSAECLRAMHVGVGNRRVGETTMNRHSSRSHSVFSLYIESTEELNGVRTEKYSRFNMIDLAGSERQKSTGATGTRLKEAARINQSLSALGNVIMALADLARGKDRHVPYRDSKLTFLLRDSLGGNSLTYILACASPAGDSFGETLSTLKFAARAKFIKNKAVVNRDLTGTVGALQSENDALRDEIRRLLAMKEARATLTYTTPRKAMAVSRLSPVGEQEATLGGGGGGGGFDEAVQPDWQSMLKQALQREKEVRGQLAEAEKEKENLHTVVLAAEKQLQSSAMILGLRNRSIANMQAELKRAQKNHLVTPREHQLEGMVKALEEEKAEWEAMLKHHPKVAQKEVQVMELEDRIAELESLMVKEDRHASTEYTRMKTHLAGVQAHNFELADKMVSMTDAFSQLQSQVIDLEVQLASPTKLLAAMPTPKRHNFESMELAKWRSEQAFQDTLVHERQAALKEKEVSYRAHKDMMRTNDMLMQRNRIYEGKVEMYEAKLHALATDHEHTLKRIDEEHRTATSSAKARHVDTYKRLMTEHADALRKMRETYEQQLRNTEEDARDSQQQQVKMTELQNELASLRTQLQNSEDEMAALQSSQTREVETLQARVTQLQDAFVAADAEVLALRDSQANLKQELQARVNELEQSLQDALSNVAATEQRLKEKEEAHMALKQSYEAVLKRHDEYVESLKSYVSRSAELQDEVTMLEQMVETKAREVDEMTFAKELLEDNNETLMEQYNFEEANVQELTAKLDDTERRLAELTTANADKEAHVGALTDEVTSLRAEVREMGTRITDDQVHKLMAEKQLLTQQIDEMTERVHATQVEAAAMQRSVSEVTAELTAQQRAYAELRTVEQDLRTTWQQMKTRAEHAEGALKAAQSELEEATARMQEYQAQIQRHSELADEAEQSLAIEQRARIREVGEMMSTLNSVKQSLTESEARAYELGRELERLQADNEHHARMLDERLTAEKAELTTKLEALRQQVGKQMALKLQAEQTHQQRQRELQEQVVQLEQARAEVTSVKNALLIEAVAREADIGRMQANLDTIGSLMARSGSGSNGDDTEEQDSDGGGGNNDDADDATNMVVESARNALASYHSMRSELAAAKSEYQTTVQQLSAQRTQAVEERDELATKLCDVEDARSAAATALESAQAEVVQLGARVRELEETAATEAASNASEMSAVTIELEAERSECQRLADTLTAMETVASAHTNAELECQQQVDEAQRQCDELDTQLEAQTQKLVQVQAAYHQAKDELDKALVGKEEVLLALEKCGDEEERTFQECQQLKSRVEALEDEQARRQTTLGGLKKSNDDLREENAKLIGHQNLRQKIQLHLAIKIENDQLRAEKLKLEHKLLRYRKEFGALNSAHDDDGAVLATVEQQQEQLHQVHHDFVQFKAALGEILSEVADIAPEVVTVSLRPQPLGEHRRGTSNVTGNGNQQQQQQQQHGIDANGNGDENAQHSGGKHNKQQRLRQQVQVQEQEQEQMVAEESIRKLVDCFKVKVKQAAVTEHQLSNERRRYETLHKKYDQLKQQGRVNTLMIPSPYITRSKSRLI